MDKRFSSLLEELSDYAPTKDRDLFVESRAKQVIASAINLLVLIERTYDAETADELERRLINSIKGRDDQKFSRKIRQIAAKSKGGDDHDKED